MDLGRRREMLGLRAFEQLGMKGNGEKEPSRARDQPPEGVTLKLLARRGYVRLLVHRSPWFIVILPVIPGGFLENEDPAPKA